MPALASECIILARDRPSISCPDATPMPAASRINEPLPRRNATIIRSAETAFNDGDPALKTLVITNFRVPL